MKDSTFDFRGIFLGTVAFLRCYFCCYNGYQSGRVVSWIPSDHQQMFRHSEPLLSFICNKNKTFRMTHTHTHLHTCILLPLFPVTKVTPPWPLVSSSEGKLSVLARTFCLALAISHRPHSPFHFMWSLPPLFTLLLLYSLLLRGPSASRTRGGSGSDINCVDYLLFLAASVILVARCQIWSQAVGGCCGG